MWRGRGKYAFRRTVSSDSNATVTPQDKLRSLFLTGLVLFSVFAGTIAVSGGAAAAANVSVQQAVEYSGGGGGGGSTVELALTGPVTNGLDGNNELEIYLDGNEVSDTVFDGVSRDGSSGRVEISLTRDVTPDRNLTVKLTDFGGGSITAADIDVTSQTFTPDSGDQSYVNIYQGEPIAITDPDAGSDTDLLVETDDGGIVFQDSYTDNSHVYVFDTADLEPGQNHDITSGSDTAGFKVNNLSFDVEMEGTNVTDEDDIVAEVTALRGGTAASATLSNSEGETVDSLVKDLESTEAVEFDFGSRSTDGAPYTVTVTDNQTGITATSEEISVSESQEGNVHLNKSVVAEERGDVVSITYDLSNTDEGYIVIGDKSETNYAISGQITDDDGDGKVTVQFNSYLAGVPNSGNASIAASDVLSATADDEISDVSESGTFKRSDLTVETLDAGNYMMNATTGTSQSTSPDSVGTLQLEDRSTEGMQSWVAPRDADLADGDADIYDRIGTNLTQAEEIADGDIVVHRITAAGVEGPLEYRQDVKGASDTTAAFLQATGNEGTFHFWANRTNVGANADGVPLQLNSTNVVVVDDPDNNTYFVAVELANTDYRSGTPVHDGESDEIAADFSVTDSTGLADDEDSVEDTYEITDREATLSMTDGLVTTQAAAGQPVTGTTTVAPGSEISVGLESDSDADPFISRPDAAVTQNGTFTATADMSEYSAGTNFTAAVRDVNGDSFGADEDGRIVSVASTSSGGGSPDANVTSPETTTEQATDDSNEELADEQTEAPTAQSTERPTAEPTTMAPPDEQTERGTTPASGPGFTAGAALAALVAAALLTVRRDS